MFPDLFAFAPAMGLMSWQRLAGAQQVMAPGAHGPAFDLAWRLYEISHSLMIFGAAFALVWLLTKRPWLAMLGWPLHVLIDIPTHTARFFPTPFLWPISSYKFSGISWGNPWFMLVNWSAIAIVYFLLWRSARRGRREQYEPEMRMPLR